MSNDIKVTVTLYLPASATDWFGNDISWLLRSEVCPAVEHETLKSLMHSPAGPAPSRWIVEIDDPEWRK